MIKHKFRPHKYNAKPTHVDGIRFDSKKEAQRYRELKIRRDSEDGDVLFFLRQVPIHLPGGVVLRIDFLEFHRDGSVHFTDSKGMRTQQYILKKKQVEALYPVKIEEV